MRRSSDSPSRNLRTSTNLSAFNDSSRKLVDAKPKVVAKPKRTSIFSSFSLDFGAEVEMAQDEVKAKVDALNAPPVRSIAIRQNQLSVVEHVVNDDEQWQKFKSQMRNGGTKTGMQLRHNLDSLLASRAEELEATGAVTPTKVEPCRRATISDFASSLIRGEGNASKPHNRRASTFSSGASTYTEDIASVGRRGSVMSNRSSFADSVDSGAAYGRRGSTVSNRSSFAESIDEVSHGGRDSTVSNRASNVGVAPTDTIYATTRRIAEYLIDGD